MQKKSATFLKLPEYPGGKEQFREFVKEHLKYPEEALEKKVEGTVFLSADVSGKGQVSNINVEKGIGYGCDEEAVRILSLMHFGGVKNRGVRVITRKKFRINFKLPPQKKSSRQISYTYKEPGKQTENKQPVSYSYTINLNKEV
ncbi:MAG: TonB family protein [Prolixibacteraceae bacterium]|nr:TonB family protein [Prolixibacteraceae bacterium]MBN2773297.1 TonB family protein [Prolixibacteraceae bacterium]